MAAELPSPRLYDTLSREERELKRPRTGRDFGFYCCGPTVYAAATIGNFRTFVLQDVMRRVLEVAGYPVRHVRNITDIDDKTIRDSIAAGKSLRDFTRQWTERFHADAAKLNLLPPHAEPRATEHIPQQVAMVEELIAKGLAYASADGSVYFRVGAFPGYGRLANIAPENLRTQATTSGGAANLADEYSREQVADFALWKGRKEADGENHWESPWGDGRPGWHLECSAMSLEHLEAPIDLHSGGVDLTFPHHENEIAQSEGATGCTFVRHWMHCAHLIVEGERMGKSLGNAFTVDDIEAKGYPPTVLRYVLLSGHYRQQLNFTFNGLDAARSALERIEEAARAVLPLPYPATEKPKVTVTREALDTPLGKVLAALYDDLGTPAALGALFSALKAGVSDKEAPLLQAILYALGIPVTEAQNVEAPAEVRQLAEQRWEAKMNRNFAEADRLRGEVEATGWKILDRKDGFDLEQA